MTFEDVGDTLQPPESDCAAILGERIELARGSDGGPTFLVWDGDSEEPTTRNGTEMGGTISKPPGVPPSIWDRLTLPSGFGYSLSTRQLYEDVAAVLAQNGAENLVVPLTFFVFATWLPERAPVAPFLWVVIPDPCAIVALRESIRLLCRHALVVNPLAPNWPNNLPMALQPALITEIDQPSGRLLRTFAASQTHCLYPTGKGQAVDPFCPKLIFARAPLVDRGAAGFPLQFFLDSRRTFIPPLGPEEAAAIAEKLQNQLLRYRMMHLSAPPANIDLSRFSIPVQAAGQSLVAGIFDDHDLQARIVAYLAEVDDDLKTDEATSMPAMIVEVLTRRRNEQQIAVADLTGDVNTVMMARGLTIQLSPERIGWQLKNLGIRTKAISRGKVVVMAEVLPTIDELAARWGVPALDAEA